MKYLLIATLLIFCSCKKSDDKKNDSGSNNTSGNTGLLFNPDNCKMVETFMTTNSVKYLYARHYYSSGENLDSNVFYNQNGTRANYSTYTGYTSQYCESINYNANGSVSSKGFIWKDSKGRTTRQRIEGPGGNVIVDNQFEYSCK